MSKYKDVYGKYSLGSGAILTDQDKVWDQIADPEVLSAYEKSIKRDLVKSGISVNQLGSWEVMDVGTGRQALSFLNLGAKSVDHFDISPENVERLSQYINANSLQKKLTSSCCDIVETDLGKDKYDFIYLNGIVQHFSDVGVGVQSCMSALRKGGYLWLYFYRSGTFDNFMLYMIRDLIHSSNVASEDEILKEHFISSILSFSRDVTKNYLTSIYIDGAFTRFANLYSLSSYMKFVEERGFEVVSSSGLDPLGKEVDHFYSRAATVITVKKIRDDIDFSNIENSLCPENDVNQLDKSLYDQDDILHSIELYANLKEILAQSNVPRSLTVFAALRLFDFLATETRAPDYDPMQRHTDLQTILSRSINILQDEYGDV